MSCVSKCLSIDRRKTISFLYIFLFFRKRNTREYINIYIYIESYNKVYILSEKEERKYIKERRKVH